MMADAKVLIVGRSGQVATALQAARWPKGVAVRAFGRQDLDLRRASDIARVVPAGGWSVVVNAAAYTQVDRAESERDAAFALNRDGPATLASACLRAGIPLIHLSTDYVFDGRKHGSYVEDDLTNPVSVYGASKAEGEAAVRAILEAHVILRTSWVFSPVGNNFVKTMLRVGAERRELRVVDDQCGRPSGAQDIADAIVRIVSAILDGKADGFGTFHFANAGATSWYRFAREIFRQAAERGFSPTPDVKPIPSSEYVTQAQRPKNSVLDTGRFARVYGVAIRPWQHALSETMDALLSSNPSTASDRAGASS